MTTFYFIRHGQNERLAGDQPLNAAGRVQAAKTAAHFAGVAVDAVYASPLARARQTVEPIAARIGQSVVVDSRLRERANFGDLPEQTLADFVAMWKQCDADRSYTPEAGLSARANGERLEAWMRDVHTRLPAGTVVAGTHGGTITDFLLNRFTTDELSVRTPEYRHMQNCSITVVVFDGERFSLDLFASTTHLS